MSTVIEVPAYGPTANFIVSEANGYRSREQIVVAQGGLYPDGTILQAQDGDEVKYAPFAGGGGRRARRAVSDGGRPRRRRSGDRHGARLRIAAGDAEIRRRDRRSGAR